MKVVNAMKYVRVHKIDGKTDKVVEVGKIFIRDGKIDYHPRDSRTLKQLAAETVRRFPYKTTGEQGVDASEPDVFLESLHYQYQGFYFRVGPVEGGVRL